MRVPASPRTGLAGLAALVLVGVGAAACTPPADDANADADAGRIVLADTGEVGEYNPVAGYSATGVSPLYEGLLRPNAPDDHALPALEPALAAAAPVVTDDGRTWTVHLRAGVHFHDGTDLDSGDVAATYRAVLDPASASPIASDYAPVERVDTPEKLTVVFHLRQPDHEFASRLLLGIAPSERLTGGPATASTLNTDPVGTGPYRLESLRGTEAVFTADPGYRDGPPAVRTLVIRSVPDENTRAQQLLTGEVSGAALPPRLASSLDGRDGLSVTAVHSADWRGISLPMSNPFTADRQVRRALNIAVDRAAVVDRVLAGHGSPTVTPLSAAYPEHLDADVTTTTDAAGRTAEAEELLDRAGWRRGPDGIRTNGGRRAAFSVDYPAQDSLRRELASAFADQMRPLGVDVTVTGASWDDIEPRAADTGILLGGGDNPYTAETQTWRALHTRTAAAGPYDNPGRYSDPAVDAALDAARSSGQPERTRYYGDAQRAYLANPGYVFLATLDHTYVTRDTGYSGPAPVLEPHSHGVLWGPWWSIGRWTATR